MRASGAAVVEGIVARKSSVAPGAMLGGKYRVEQCIAEGGMSFVLSAYHTDLDEKVAIKVLKPEFLAKPDVVARFAREAKTTTRIRSEH